jgi:hypothetical protein
LNAARMMARWAFIMFWLPIQALPGLGLMAFARAEALLPLPDAFVAFDPGAGVLVLDEMEGRDLSVDGNWRRESRFEQATLRKKGQRGRLAREWKADAAARKLMRRRFALDPRFENATSSVQTRLSQRRIDIRLDGKLDGHWYRLSAPLPKGWRVKGVVREDGVEIANGPARPKGGGRGVVEPQDRWWVEDGRVYFYDDPVSGYSVLLVPPAPNYSLAVELPTTGLGQISGIVYPYGGEDMSVAANDRLEHLGGTNDNGFGYDLDGDAGAKIALRYTANSTTVQYGNPTAASNTGANGNFVNNTTVTTPFHIAPDGQTEAVIASTFSAPGAAPAAVRVTQKVVLRGNAKWFASIYYIENLSPSFTLSGVRFFQGADWNFNGSFNGDNAFHIPADDITYGYVNTLGSKPAGSAISAGGFRSPVPSAAHQVSAYNTLWANIRNNALNNANNFTGDAGTGQAWDLPNIPPLGRAAVPVVFAYANTLNATLYDNLRDEIALGLAKLNDAGVRSLGAPAQGSVHPTGAYSIPVNGVAALYGVRDLYGLPVRVSVSSSVAGHLYDAAVQNVDLLVPDQETQPFNWGFDVTGLPAGTYTLRFYTDMAALGLSDSVPANDHFTLTLHLASFSLQPSTQSATASAGSVQAYSITLDNRGAAQDYQLRPLPSSLGWGSELYNGMALLAQDLDGDGAWDGPDPVLSLGAASTLTLTLNKLVPGLAAPSTVDQSGLYAFSTSTALHATATAATTVRQAGSVGKTLYLHPDAAGNSMNTFADASAPGTFTTVPRFGIIGWAQRPSFARDMTFDTAIDLSLYLSSGGVNTSSSYVEVFSTNGFSSELIGTLALPAFTQANPAAGNDPPLRSYSIPLSAPVTVPRGHYLVFQLYAGSQTGLRLYQGAAARSRLDISAYDYVNVDQIGLSYASGEAASAFARGATVVAQATVSDPFGSFDIAAAYGSFIDPNGVTQLAPLQRAVPAARDGGARRVDRQGGRRGVQRRHAHGPDHVLCGRSRPFAPEPGLPIGGHGGLGHAGGAGLRQPGHGIALCAGGSGHGERVGRLHGTGGGLADRLQHRRLWAGGADADGCDGRDGHGHGFIGIAGQCAAGCPGLGAVRAGGPYGSPSQHGERAGGLAVPSLLPGGGFGRESRARCAAHHHHCDLQHADPGPARVERRRTAGLWLHGRLRRHHRHGQQPGGRDGFFDPGFGPLGRARQ